jgi:hypothetical protein
MSVKNLMLLIWFNDLTYTWRKVPFMKWFSICTTSRNSKFQWLFVAVMNILVTSHTHSTTSVPRPSPCGGGVEYLHRDLASRRRRRKGESRIWDSKLWPRVLWDSDQKMTALARTSRNCKQTRPLIREGAQNQQTRNCQTKIKIWLYAPDGCFIPRQTGRLTVGHNIKLDSTQLSS